LEALEGCELSLLDSYILLEALMALTTILGWFTSFKLAFLLLVIASHAKRSGGCQSSS